jgi:hypothetical protein
MEEEHGLESGPTPGVELGSQTKGISRSGWPVMISLEPPGLQAADFPIACPEAFDSPALA